VQEGRAAAEARAAALNARLQELFAEEEMEEKEQELAQVCVGGCCAVVTGHGPPVMVHAPKTVMSVPCLLYCEQMHQVLLITDWSA
jgi:hypothetical protein